MSLGNDIDAPSSEAFGLNKAALEQNINFSQVLQEALIEKLSINKKQF